VKEVKGFTKLPEPITLANELLEAGWKIVQIEFFGECGTFGAKVAGAIKVRKLSKRERAQ
jgi:hypothetical protein